MTRGNIASFVSKFFLLVGMGDGVQKGRRARPHAKVELGCHARLAGVSPSYYIYHDI